MTTTDTLHDALRHIAAGHDAVCTDCGLIGNRRAWASQSPWWVTLFRYCPLCGGKTVKIRANEIAAYALRQVGGGE